MEVELELGSNEAVKRAVAAGLGFGCLSHLAVKEAIAEGWLVELAPSNSAEPVTCPDLATRHIPSLAA